MLAEIRRGGIDSEHTWIVKLGETQRWLEIHRERERK
jgi:hypothetical protein